MKLVARNKAPIIVEVLLYIKQYCSNCNTGTVCSGLVFIFVYYYYCIVPVYRFLSSVKTAYSSYYYYIQL